MLKQTTDAPKIGAVPGPNLRFSIVGDGLVEVSVDDMMIWMHEVKASMESDKNKTDDPIMQARLDAASRLCVNVLTNLELGKMTILKKK